MKKILTWAACFLSLFLGGVTVWAANESLYVNGDAVNLRNGPDTKAQVVMRIKKGAEVVELRRQAEWVNIKIKDSEAAGWIHSSFLQNNASFFVMGDQVNIRSGPGKEFPVVTKASLHTEVVEKSRQGEWSNVDIVKTGDTGWISSTLLGKTKNAVDASGMDSQQTPKEKTATSPAWEKSGPWKTAGFTQGTRTMADGSKYIGQFKQGVFHGNGVLIYPDGRRYEGEFRNGLFYGDGAMKLEKGGYEGQWKDGKFHGQGTLTRFDGSKYIGLWDNNKWTGMGKYISPEGNVYEGEWLEGMFHGKGTMTYKDGEKKTGRWEKGRFAGN